MARRTYLYSPSPEDIRALLHDAGLSAYAAAPLVGVSVQALQQAIDGKTTLRGGLWELLRIKLVQAERDALPEPLLKEWRTAGPQKQKAP